MAKINTFSGRSVYLLNFYLFLLFLCGTEAKREAVKEGKRKKGEEPTPAEIGLRPEHHRLRHRLEHGTRISIKDPGHVQMTLVLR